MDEGKISERKKQTLGGKNKAQKSQPDKETPVFVDKTRQEQNLLRVMDQNL